MNNFNDFLDRFFLVVILIILAIVMCLMASVLWEKTADNFGIMNVCGINHSVFYSQRLDSTHYNCYRGTEVILEDGIYKEKPIYEPVEVKDR